MASKGDLEAAEAKRIGVKGGSGAVKGRRDLKAEPASTRPQGCSAGERRETQTGPHRSGSSVLLRGPRQTVWRPNVP